MLLKSTARISPREHVGTGSIHDSHTIQTGNTGKFSFVGISQDDVRGGRSDGSKSLWKDSPHR